MDGMTIKVGEVVEQPDGSALTTFEMGDDAAAILFRIGCRVELEEAGLDVQVLPPTDLDPEAKRVEIGNEEFERIVGVGILDCLMRACKEIAEESEK
jgi:hypothetical protein